MSVTRIPDDLRLAVIARDGTNCLRCRVQCTFAGPRKLHIDHIIPESRGGRTNLDNLQVLCRTCNLAKGDRSCADYRPTPTPRVSRRQQRREARAERQMRIRPGERLELDRICQRLIRLDDHPCQVHIPGDVVESANGWLSWCRCGWSSPSGRAVDSARAAIAHFETGQAWCIGGSNPCVVCRDLTLADWEVFTGIRPRQRATA